MKALLGGLLLLSLVTQAEAIIVTCPAGFQDCDPYTGTCATAWTATFNGQAQANCTVNPVGCWLQSLTTPQCSAPVPPPVNPNAIRVCPWGADCGVGYPPHRIDQYYPSVRAGANPADPHIIYYYQGHPSITGPLLPPTIDVNLVLDCILYHSPLSPLGDGLACPPGSNDWSGRIVRPPTVIFEPAPTCGWSIAPASPVQPCQVAAAAILGSYKDSSTQWTGLSNYFTNIQRRANRLGRNLALGKYGNPLSTRYAIMSRRFAWLDTLLTGLAVLVMDPPNSSYQFLPGPSTAYPAVTTPPLDGTMTAAEVTQHLAWLNALRDVVIVQRQLSDTLDNLAGAIVAAEAGTPGAAIWVRILALHFDAVAATLASKGALEIQARAGITGPVVTEDAACGTPTDALNAMKVAVQNGSTLYGGFLVQEALPGVCAPAATYPAFLAADSALDAPAYAGLTALGAAPYLCAHGPYCARFADVPVTHPFFAAIDSLAKAGITAGCTSPPDVPMYCPDTSVTRDQMAIFLLKAKYGGGYAPPGAVGLFSDVPVSYWAAPWIERLVAEGLTGGCATNPLRYCPTSVVTRDQMAVFLLKLKHGGGYVPPPVGQSTGFSDVPLSYWAAPWIKQLALEGVTSGCGGGQYCPTNPVTRGQMAVFLKNTVGLP